MKKKYIIVLSVVVFLIACILFGEFNAKSDGFTKVGFPFTFYIGFAGKCIDCDFETGFDLIKFILDLIVFSSIGFVLYFFIKYLQSKN